MQRLTGIDAGFLYMETPTSPMHVAGLAVYDPSDSPGWTVDAVKEVLQQRLHLAPPYRRRLATVPLGLHHPVWIEDPDFDLGWHVRHVGVPSPGGRRELADLAANLVSLPLDRSRPLWEMWIIEGLEHGHVATLTKVHHAAIDGASGNELTVSLFDLSPEVAEVPPPEEPWRPDRVPTDPELIGYALNSLARQPVRAVKTLRRTVATALNLRSANRQPDAAPPPAPFSAPRTAINAALTPHRSYAMTTLSLAEVKRVKNAFGVTVNDVVLALCAGTLRRYFDARGEQLERPLVAMVPVSVRAETEKAAMGNRVSSMLASLATDVDDPVERLAVIHEGMRQAKEQQQAIGADTLTDWAEFAAPAVFSRAVRLYSRTRMADRHRPIFNVTISNVPGPPFPLYSAGARLTANYPMGPIFDGGGLNMTVMSYQDNLDFGLLACPELVDDVWSIADGLGDALEELTKAAAATKPATNGAREKAASPAVSTVDGASSGEPATNGITTAAATLEPTSAADTSTRTPTVTAPAKKKAARRPAKAKAAGASAGAKKAKAARPAKAATRKTPGRKKQTASAKKAPAARKGPGSKKR
jgi:WS/DGAT/MGAT family acyltransferase